MDGIRTRRDGGGNSVRKFGVFALLAILAGAIPVALKAQTGIPSVTIRGFWSHSPGFDVMERLNSVAQFYAYHTDVKAGWGGGVGAELVKVADLVSIGLDVDWLPSAQLERETGRPLYGESGAVTWLTLSTIARPTQLCWAICVAPIVGAGWARLRLDYDDLSDDIVADYFEPQTVPALRVGVTLSASGVSDRLALQLIDYVNVIDTSRSNANPDWLHVLQVAVAWTWSPTGR